MLVIAGCTCSGKTTIVNELMKCGFHKLVTTTTRPMRSGETQDVDYHFISDEEFKQKSDDGYFAEYKLYHAKDGDWYYGTAISDIENVDNKTVVILTPEGVRDIKKIQEDIFVIYIYVNNQTIEKRLLCRGDNKDEAKRRILADRIDFRGFELEVDKIVYNNDDVKIDNVVNRILTLV